MPIDPSIPLSVKPLVFDPAQAASQILSIRQAGQQITATSLENQQRQNELDATRAINQAFKDSLTVDETGVPSLDQNKFTATVGKAGFGSKVPGILAGYTKAQQAYAGLQKTKNEVAEQERDAAGAAAAGVRTIGDDGTSTFDPEGIKGVMLHGAHVAGYDTADDIQQKYDALGPVEKQAEANRIGAALVAGSHKQQQVDAAAATARARGKAADTGANREAREAGKDAYTNAISQLANAKSAEQAQRIYQGLPKGVADKIQMPDVWDEKAPAFLRAQGMTPAQQASTLTAEQRLELERKNGERMQAHQNTQDRLAQARVDLEQKKFDVDPNRNDPTYRRDFQNYQAYLTQRNRKLTADIRTFATTHPGGFVDPSSGETPPAYEEPQSFQEWRKANGATPPTGLGHTETERTTVTPKGGAVPAPVTKALKGQKDGKYTLNDNSVWFVKGGVITPGQ